MNTGLLPPDCCPVLITLAIACDQSLLCHFHYLMVELVQSKDRITEAEEGELR